ncbi:hypothetical protein K788_00013920 [Paraburkholderia caribensis MBA4]|uniref:Uncharacterized protein n=1 Tax=Paraburkholderia caribensis MBA4 TaxID=1323664 RepID=A0A0P0R747_9BURK|nr:hypothetical protein K788_00013920 [Paraburkholderia caribensis MBA4]
MLKNIRGKRFAFTTLLRQQQRNEIMKNLFRFVNRFF